MKRKRTVRDLIELERRAEAGEDLTADERRELDDAGDSLRKAFKSIDPLGGAFKSLTAMPNFSLPYYDYRPPTFKVDRAQMLNDFREGMRMGDALFAERYGDLSPPKEREKRGPTDDVLLTEVKQRHARYPKRGISFACDLVGSDHGLSGKAVANRIKEFTGTKTLRDAVA